VSFKTGLIKFAVKWTPKSLILWVANMKLKGVARLTDFWFDIDARKAYVRTHLVGETEAIEVWVEDFAILNEKGAYQLIVKQARSNREWLNNVFSRIVGKAWAIPVIPQLAPHMGLVCELFKADTTNGSIAA
jgi:hypothetical protein